MIRRAELPNGLRLIVREMRTAPVVAMNLWVGSGSSDDPEELSGISHFMEHMLFRGTDAEGGIDLAREVHDAGGYLNAETGCDHTMYYQVVPSVRWKGVLRAVVEAASSPAFRAADVDGERGVIVEEARSGESDPGTFVWHRLMEAVFPKHPCRRPIVGTPKSVSRVTSEALREHHAAHYGARNLVQVIVGDVDAEEALDVAAGALAGMPSGLPRTTRRPAEREARGLRAAAYEGSVDQPYLALAFDGPHALHPDVPALDALCGLLGVGHSSRLARSLRDGEGIVSAVGCGVVAYRDTGLLAVRAVASTDDLDRVCESVFRETERLRREPPDGSEMEKNLRRLEAAYVLEHETPDSIANTLGFFETLGDYTWAEEYIDRLASVGTDDILRVARNYLDADAATFISYAPGPPGAPAVDRAPDVRACALRGAESAGHAQGVVRERPAVWSAPQAFSRPQVLRESPVTPCTRLELSNGGSMIACESKVLPIVAVTAGLRGGFTEERPSKDGLTYLSLKMALQGTSTRSAEEISEHIEGLGSALATAVERDGFGLGFTVVSKHLEEAADVVGDVLSNASFPESRLDHVRRLVASEIIAADDQPLRRAMVALLPLAFPGLPHGRPIRGTLESVGRATAPELAAWYRSRCAADRLRVCVIGDVSPERARDVVESALAGLSGTPVAEDDVSATSTHVVRPTGSSVGELPASPQSVVTVALAGPPGGTGDAVAARVIVRALSMMGGRLWTSLRERPPYAYHVGGALLAYARAGATVGYATAAPGQERAVGDGLLAEFARLGDGGLEADELARTRQHLAGTLEISLMRAAARSASYAMSEVMGAGYEYVRDLAGEVRRVTNDDVVRVARTYMNPADGFAEAVVRGESPRT
ncbi:MAG: pitrilysin family protein [Candidatus Eisenbacteria bacterium]